MIWEVSKEIVDLIIKAKLSPPICFGCFTNLGRESWFIGLCTEQQMDRYLREKYF